MDSVEKSFESRPIMEELAGIGWRDWAGLPNKLLTLIASHLVLDDLRAFHSVCKTWELIEPPPLQPQWLMICKGLQSTKCRFYHPVYRHPYLKDIPTLSNSRLQCSKQGWQLMFRDWTSVFFLNPFTEETINLPDLPNVYQFDAATFTSSPTRTDCRVFCIIICQTYIIISTIQRGDTSWKTYEFEHNLPIDLSFCNPVFYNEMLHCLGRRGNVGVFDPSQGQWTVLADPAGLPCDLAEENYLMECQGKLLTVFVGKRGKWIAVFRLDDTKMIWERVNNLGDQMLFLSKSTSFSATKVADGMENRIYFPRMIGNHGVIFYSLATGKYHTSGNDHSLIDLNNTKEMLHSTWVEPLMEKHARREAIKTMKKKLGYKSDTLNLPSPQSGPWLLFTQGTSEFPAQTFYSVEERRCYVKSIPDLSGNVICAASHGWMVIVSSPVDGCFLLNMVSMEKIMLPQCDPDEFPWLQSCVLSAPPTDPDCVVAFFNTTLPCRVMFCKPGDKEWVQQDLGDLDIRVVTAVQRKMYCLTYDSNVLIRLDVVDHNISMARLATNQTPCPSDFTHGAIRHNSYLVESCGEMFLVQIALLPVEDQDKILEVQVCKMNFSNSNWERVETLGDHRALFINAKGNCISCRSTSESSSSGNIKGDTIYFILDGDTSMYVFDMGDDSIYVCEPCPDHLLHNWLQTFWVMPLA